MGTVLGMGGGLGVGTVIAMGSIRGGDGDRDRVD